MPAPRFKLAQMVYLKIDTAEVGCITGVLSRQTGVLYCVTWAADREERQHYDFELSEERNFGTTEE